MRCFTNIFPSFPFALTPSCPGFHLKDFAWDLFLHDFVEGHWIFFKQMCRARLVVGQPELHRGGKQNSVVCLSLGELERKNG